MTKSRNDRPSDDQRGVISIIVVSILTITLALIAIGFSRLADRELRQASDREESVQAYYAAQSGVNDAIAYIADGGTAFSGCANWPSSPVNGNQYFAPDLSSPAGEPGAAKYSCISVDPTPQTLSYPVTPGKPQIVKISASGLKNLLIGWQNTNGGMAGLGSFGDLPIENGLNPNATGVLRVGIYQVSGGSVSNDDLANDSMVFYLYPNSGSGNPGSATYSPGQYKIKANGPIGSNGDFVRGNCRASGNQPYCSSEIKGFSNNTYYLYLTAQYAPLSVQITGTNAANKPVSFSGDQVSVDVTGQASGQIQRIRAAIGLNDQFDTPNYAVQSMETLCKAFNLEILPPVGGVGQYGSATLASGAPSDNACQAPDGGGPIAGGGTAGH